MSYSAITNMRIPYDIDGTVGYARITSTGTTDITQATAVTNSQMSELNDSDNTTVFSTASSAAKSNIYFWLFFSEPVMLERSFIQGSTNITSLLVETSSDTTNGMDGSWTTATFPEGGGYTVSSSDASWRTNSVPLTVSGPCKTLRLKIVGAAYDYVYLNALHLYGHKAVGETPDDLIFCEADGTTEITAVNDFGDRPEGTTAYDDFRLKNTSATKTANNIVIDTSGDFLLSLSESGPWTTSVEITSIGADMVSAETIHIRNEIGAPPQTLGPKAAKCTASIGSWT